LLDFLLSIFSACTCGHLHFLVFDRSARCFRSTKKKKDQQDIPGLAPSVGRCPTIGEMSIYPRISPRTTTQEGGRSGMNLGWHLDFWFEFRRFPPLLFHLSPSSRPTTMLVRISYSPFTATHRLTEC
jgi:hypothetical protein